MIQLLNSVQNYDAFEIADSQTINRQTFLPVERETSPERESSKSVAIRTTNPIADHRRSRLVARIDLICSTVVAAYFGLTTIALGHLMLKGF